MYVEESEFRDALEALHRLLEAGEAQLLVSMGRFSPPVRIMYAGDAPDVLGDALDDITDTLVAILSDADVDRFTEVRGDPERFRSGEEDRSPEPPEVARRKYELVRDSFDVDDLLRRRWLKTTSKNHELGSVEWEMALKLLDDDIGAPDDEPIPFATMRVAAETTGNPFASPLELVFTLDREDVKAMLATLSRLDSALEALASEDATS